MNNPDHISESLETIFLVKILKFFYAESGIRGMEEKEIQIWDKHPGSATLVASFYIFLVLFSLQHAKTLK